MPPTSYHNHTHFSDGRGSIGETVAAAATLGLGEIGISDHLWLGEGQPAWSIDPDAVGDYLEAIRRAAAPAGVVIRAGVELDWIPGAVDALADVIDAHPFDYVIGSVHFVGAFGVDAGATGWERLDETARDDMHRAYWTEVRRCAETGLFDIFGHIDLPKKFGYLPPTDVGDRIDAALDAVAAAGIAVEINTAGWHKPCADAYPTLDILRRCRARDIPTTISADAHRVEDLARDFHAAAARLAEAGYDEVACYAGRRRTMQPLSEAVAGLARGSETRDLDDF